MSAINLNMESFNRLIQNEKKTALIDFWAPWCSYCRRISPAFEQVAKENPNLLVGKVNIDEEPVLADRYEIKVIPTLLLLRDGEVVASIVAPESKARIEEFLSEHREGNDGTKL